MTTKETIHAVADELKITMHAEPVAWKHSRNAKEKPCLNWCIHIMVNGRLCLTCDYSAGIGHIPGKTFISKYYSVAGDAELKAICNFENKSRGKLLPEIADVLHSLASDADAIDCATFEEWAGNLGYDTDSREGEKIYLACLDIGLKLRAALGNASFVKLREAVHGY